MKVLAKIRRGIAAFLLLVFSAFFYTSCISSNAAPLVMMGKKADSYSGEDFFRGVIFMDGPVVEFIPEAVDQNMMKANVLLNPTQIRNQREVEGRIIQQIAKTNPGYFDEFKRSMQSGNQILIQKAVEESNAVVFNALAEMMNIKLEDKEKARKEVNDFISKNRDQLRRLYNDFISNEITKEQYEQKVKELVTSDNSGLSALFASKMGVDDNVEEEAIPFLTFIVITVAVVVTIAGYFAVVLAAAGAVAVETAAAIHFAVEVTTKVSNLTPASESLNYARFINSIANNLQKEA